MTKLLDFLDRLKAARMHYVLGAPTERAILVTIAVPGERWSIDESIHPEDARRWREQDLAMSFHVFAREGWWSTAPPGRELVHRVLEDRRSS